MKLAPALAAVLGAHEKEPPRVTQAVLHEARKLAGVNRNLASCQQLAQLRNATGPYLKLPELLTAGGRTRPDPTGR